MGHPGDLKNLNELDDYQVAADDADPRGWQVTATDGRGIGRVADLIVDTDSMKVRYLDVEVDRALSPTARERHLFVPTEAVAIGERERELKRITLPLTPESAERAAGTADRIPTAAAPSALKWPPAGSNGCDVHVIRGGRNG